MNKEEECILCSSNDIKTIDKVNVKDLARLYKFRRNQYVENYFQHSEIISINECSNCKLLYYSPAFQGDGKFYAEIQNDGYYLIDKQEYQEASKFIKSNDSVLDIGSGVGNFSKLIKTTKYTGLEFNPKAISIAKSNNINVINEQLEDHSISHNEFYDVVCYFQVLEHIENPDNFIKNSLRCLKKGGKLIFAVPSEDSYCGSIVNNYLNYPPHHVTRWRDIVFSKISNLFDLKLEKIIHENIHSSHSSFYVRTLIFNQLRSFLKMEIGKLDISVMSTIVYILSYLLGILMKPFYFKILNKKPFGQSVIVIYTKN